jgi:hypothetical protein
MGETKWYKEEIFREPNPTTVHSHMTKTLGSSQWALPNKK